MTSEAEARRAIRSSRCSAGSRQARDAASLWGSGMYLRGLFILAVFIFVLQVSQELPQDDMSSLVLRESFGEPLLDLGVVDLLSQRSHDTLKFIPSNPKP